MYKKLYTKKQKGFTLLFAVLISMLVASIGATIISISTRQIILSGTSRESQYAFYAANTALECAYYWDRVVDNLPDGNLAFPLDSASSTSVALECGGGDINSGSGFSVSDFNLWDPDFSTPPGGSTHTFGMVVENKASSGIDISTPQTCAEVKVIKDIDTIYADTDNDGIDEEFEYIKTKIEAKGYNTCDIINNPRAVERGVEIEY